MRDRQNHVVIAGPVMHREAPGEHDNWIGPLLFEGKRTDGGYFHSLPLLTSSQWGPDSAFTVSLLYFRTRKLKEVDVGVAPFVFHGDNGDVDGARKRYTLIPPLFYYHRTRELDQNTITVAGPVLSTQTPERKVLDVLPFYWSIRGNPATGGIRESHTTLLPFFHYGTSDAQTLLVVPGYLRRKTPTADTFLTPFYSFALTRKGASSLEVAGPLVPLYYRKRDRDTGASALGIFPFYYGSHSPQSSVAVTPLFGHFETVGVSRTTWAFPSLVLSKDTHGWESDFWPVAFLGRKDQSTHTVLAPVFWDFASAEGAHHDRLPRVLALRRQDRQLGHPGRRQHAVHPAPRPRRARLAVPRAAGVVDGRVAQRSLVERARRARRLPARGELHAHQGVLAADHDQRVGERGGQGPDVDEVRVLLIRTSLRDD